MELKREPKTINKPFQNRSRHFIRKSDFAGVAALAPHLPRNTYKSTILPAGNLYGNKMTLMKLGAGPKLLKLLDEGAPGAKEHAAGAIQNLVVNEDSKMTLMKLGAGPNCSSFRTRARLVRRRGRCLQRHFPCWNGVPWGRAVREAGVYSAISLAGTACHGVVP